MFVFNCYMQTYRTAEIGPSTAQIMTAVWTLWRGHQHPHGLKHLHAVFGAVVALGEAPATSPKPGVSCHSVVKDSSFLVVIILQIQEQVEGQKRIKVKI